MVSPSPVPPYLRVVEGVGLVKGLEQPGPLLRGQAYSGVPHAEAGRNAFFIGLDKLGLDHYLPFFGELDRIVGQVDQDLAQPQGIALQGPGQTRIDVEQELQALFLGPEAHQAGDVVQDLFQGEVHRLHAQLSGFDLGEIQDVVDDAQESLGV